MSADGGKYTEQTCVKHRSVMMILNFHDDACSWRSEVEASTAVRVSECLSTRIFNANELDRKMVIRVDSPERCLTVCNVLAFPLYYV